ncbi:DUF2201 family putative metallopeptidase [Trichocoleus sp. FACHB-262]|uniref:vWA domain-containing protein n=1 Tax=Trichocoleus sp. FACHB-262 TaxID=2692869 RepID=UPI001685A039|nr:VWA-like domain-containing protein [Trichocoleus sp. FACHB-262]MBD2124625.1 hypothetical protein [Trichocoleus sp. FACHB-262]
MVNSSVDAQFQRHISSAILKLQTRSPFFATLALFTRIRASSIVDTAATDGRDIFINPEFTKTLSTPALDGLLLHEVLHAALLHVPRRRTRDRLLWNIAADIVVNGMVAQQAGLEVPPGAIRDKSLEHLSVEEVYELMQKESRLYSCTLVDLVDGNGANLGGEHNQAGLEAYWRDAMRQAIVVAHATQSQGSIPAGFEREFGNLTHPQLDWRSYLWRYLVRTPTDSSGFDRRFIGRKLYLETLEGESVKVYVAIDTSGSISDRELRLFLSELGGILRSYPHLDCELYYADAAIYGPYELQSDSPPPKPLGGGSTSFVPFFENVQRRHAMDDQTGVCVYLTDGYGEFPVAPELPVLWVVTPGGLDLKEFPFGETVRLLSIA